MAGGKVLLSEGIFIIATTVTLKTNVHFQGQGIGETPSPGTDVGTTVLDATTAATPAVSATDINAFIISDMKFKGGGASGSTGAIDITRSSSACFYFMVRHVRISGATGLGLRVEGASGAGNNHGLFQLDDIIVRRSQDEGIKLRFCNDWMARNLHSEGTVGGLAAMLFRDSDSWLAVNLIAENGGNQGAAGTTAEGLYILTCDFATVTNIRGNDNNASGIRVSGTSQDLTIQGGHVRDNGIDTTLGNSVRVGILCGTSISRVRFTGLSIFDQATTQLFGLSNLPADCSLTNCAFEGNVTAPTTGTIAGMLQDNFGSLTDGVILDPGGSGAIPVTRSGHVPLVTAGAETRTLADAIAPGLTLDLYFKTDGGDCVVTTASPMNQTGNNTLTFSDIGEHIRLVSIQDGSDFEWREAARDGVVLSTV